MTRRRKPIGFGKRSIQNPAVSLTSEAIIAYLGGSATSNSGTTVNWRNAITVGPVWQAVDLISSDISRVPFVTYRATPDGRGEERALGHPVYRLLMRSVGKLTANIWLARMLGHAAIFGNAYSLILRRGATPVGLHWLHRDQVEPDWENGEYFYRVMWDQNKDGRYGMDRIPAVDMFHLQGLTLDEFGGLSLIDYARNTIGREMAAEGFADDFFRNGAVPAGWFQHPEVMDDEAHKRFLRSVESRHQGPGKRHKVGILEEGMTWNPAGVDPVDAMLLEMMRWGTKDVARFFNLPPHKLGDDAKANYNSLEQENKAYYDSSLGKWISRLEFEANAKLLSESELDAGMCCKFGVDAWNKADTAARYAAYAIAIQWGIMSRNEVRDREGLNPYEGGDEYLTPLTHGAPQDEPAAEDDPEGEDPAAEDDPPADESERSIRYDLLRERLEAAARLIGNAASRAAKKRGNFLAAINSLEGRLRAALEGKVAPALRAAVGPAADPAAIVSSLLGSAAERFVAAAECSPESLTARVADAGEGLRHYAGELARQLIFGGQDK